MVLYKTHINGKDVLSYYYQLYIYFDKEEIDAYDFRTETIKKKSYIYPIHKTKCVESDFTQHKYYHLKKELKPYQILKDGKKRFYCFNCGKLAKIIKNEIFRGGDALECKTCYYEKGMKRGRAFDLYLDNMMNK
jgi:hypothetical protein